MASQPIEYRSPQPYNPKPPIEHYAAKCFVGLGVGSILSAFIWLTGFSGEIPWPPWLLIAFLLLKLATAITLACIRNWRPLGIGLLISLPIGGLIFFGACAANFKI